MVAYCKMVVSYNRKLLRTLATKYVRYSCEAWDFGHKWGDTVQKPKVLD
jgi:hypothetical protein